MTHFVMSLALGQFAFPLLIRIALLSFPHLIDDLNLTSSHYLPLHLAV